MWVRLDNNGVQQQVLAKLVTMGLTATVSSAQAQRRILGTENRAGACDALLYRAVIGRRSGADHRSNTPGFGTHRSEYLFYKYTLRER